MKRRTCACCANCSTTTGRFIEQLFGRHMAREECLYLSTKLPPDLRDAYEYYHALGEVRVASWPHGGSRTANGHESRWRHVRPPWREVHSDEVAPVPVPVQFSVTSVEYTQHVRATAGATTERLLHPSS